MASVLYASARAVSLEKTLLGEDRLKRMIDGNAEDALKILSEVGFGTGESTKNETDAVSAYETARLCAFIKETAPDEKIAKFFLYPFDFKNAEALVKAKYLKTEPELFSCGYIDEKALKEKIFSDAYSSLPRAMGEALITSDKAFVEKLESGQLINSLFTKALYEELFALNIKNTYIEKILRAKADMINIGIALRTRDYDSAKGQFVHEGAVNKATLKAVCEEDFDKIREEFRFGEYKDAVYAALDGIESGKGLKDFEKISDGFAVKIINRNKFNQEGAFPFIRYCFYKFADIMNARIILVGHSGNLTGEEIAERIREHYEG